MASSQVRAATRCLGRFFSGNRKEQARPMNYVAISNDSFPTYFISLKLKYSNKIPSTPLMHNAEVAMHALAR